MPPPELLLQLCALMHLGLICAGLLMPRVTGLPESMRQLPPFHRQLFWMYYSFIGFSLISFGLGSFLFAKELSSGTPLARAVCLFLAAFWSLRLFFASWLLDLKPYLTTILKKIGYHVLNTAFALFIPIYAYAAFAGETR